MENIVIQNKNQLEVKEHVYDVKAHFVEVINFGIHIQELISNPDRIPPQGARFIFEFEGSVTGEKIGGTMTGSDYVYIRPDQRIELEIHTTITTREGVNISLEATGLAFLTDNPTIFNVRENISLFTSNPDYAWVNQLQIWGTGATDLVTGEMKLKCFVA